MSHSTRFLLVAKLVNVHNSAHNKHNAYWIGPHFKRLHYLDTCVLLFWQPTCCTVELKVAMEQYNSRNSRRNPYNRMKDNCFWSYLCTIHWKNFCMHSSPLPLNAYELRHSTQISQKSHETRTSLQDWNVNNVW
jgi:hypothetical protein